MQVLIFGGTGFLGRLLTQALLHRGWQVSIATRNQANAAQTLPANIRLIQLQNDDQGLPCLDQAIIANEDFKQIDAVVNLAGASIGQRRWTPAVKKEILNSRINTTRLIVNAINAGALQPKVLLNASAVGYYGSRQNELIKENASPGGDFLAQVCRQWEQEAYQVRHAFIRVVTLRIGVVLGHEGALTKMALPYKFFLGGPLGKGEQWLAWIHVQDLIRMFEFVLENEKITGPVNGTAPHPVKMKELALAIGKAMHRPAWLPVPEFMLKLALGEMSEMLLHGQRALPTKILDAGFEFYYPTIQAALADIFTS